MKYTLSVILGIVIGILFYSMYTNNSILLKDTDRVIYSKDIIILNELKGKVNVEYVESLGKNVLGQYDRNTNTISIKCQQSDSYDFIDTVAHESTHFAVNFLKQKGINDEETLAYVIGYITGETLKKVKC